MKADLKFAVGVLHPRKGGTGLTDVGPFGTVLTSDGARWLALDQTNNPFLSAAAFFIDPTNGSDIASGLAQLTSTPAQAVLNPGPLKTWAEMRRRIGAGKLSAGACTITVLGDLPASDPMLFDFGWVGTLTVVSLTLSGLAAASTTIQRSSTITAFTTRSTPANTQNQLTDGAFNWSPFIGAGFLLNVTNNSSFAWILSNQGAGVARMSTFQLASGAENIPANGNSYNVLRLTQIATASITPTAGTVLILKGFNFLALPILQTPIQVQFVQCCFSAALSQQGNNGGVTGGNLLLNNSMFSGAGSSSNFLDSTCFFQGGGAIGAQITLTGGYCSFLLGWFNQAPLAAMQFNSGSFDVTDLAIYDFGNPGYKLQRATVNCFNPGFWGTSAVASAVPAQVDNESHLIAASNPSIIATNPAAALKLGVAATVAAWPNTAASKVADVNSDATYVRY
jgi:hypothetical protein